MLGSPAEIVRGIEKLVESAFSSAIAAVIGCLVLGTAGSVPCGQLDGVRVLAGAEMGDGVGFGVGVVFARGEAATVVLVDVVVCEVDEAAVYVFDGPGVEVVLGSEGLVGIVQMAL